MYSDVDLLVAPDGIPEARQVLRQLGYRNASQALGIDDIGKVVHDESWVGASPLGKREIVIELHLRLPGSRVAADVCWKALASRRAEIELGSTLVPVLDREAQALQLATHAAQHGPGYAKGLRELTLGLERWSSSTWEGAARLAARVNSTESFAAGLRLVPAGAALAQVLGLPATDRRDWEIRHAARRPRGTFHFHALSQARGPRARLRVMRRALFPSRLWIAWQYPWARQGWPRLSVAYCLHLIRAPVWTFRAWRFNRQAERFR
jgi:hypothetical protein